MYMRKEIIIFTAVYLVVIEGLVLFLFSLQEESIKESIIVFMTGSIVLLIALIIAKILKRIIHKHRPPKKLEIFEPFDKYAFPSGHATGLSTVTFFIFERNIFLGIISFFISLFIVVARMKAKVHDYVDIIGGIILGVSVTYLISPFIKSMVSIYFIN